MALLAIATQDPGTAVVKSTAAALAMTAFDTTNLRCTFTAPANGIVQVRAVVCHHGGSTPYYGFLGVLDGSTIIARVSPFGAPKANFSATVFQLHEAIFTIGGLTPGNSYTWDLAYGVETLGGTGTPGYKYGGPNDTTVDNAFGMVAFEIHDAPKCLATVLYDPAAAVSKSTATAIVMTALDTTNLRHTITATNYMEARMTCVIHGASSQPGFLMGILEGSTIRGRMGTHGGPKGGTSSAAHQVIECMIPLVGLAGSVTLDAAYAVDTAVASSAIKYGGPNDTTVNNAFGGFLLELWDLT
jgi:hypothetical protein